MPLLALIVPVEVAAPVAVMASITVAFIVVVQDWRKIHLRSTGLLVLPTLLGIPLGLILLRTVAEPVVKGILAAVIIAFSADALLGGKHRELKNDRFAWLFGFGAGVLGGAYGMNGPPLVIYGSLRRWSPQHFRATLQGYFLPASLAGLWGYQIAGLVTPDVGRFYLWSLPCVILATFLGGRNQPPHRCSPISALCARRPHRGRSNFAATSCHQPDRRPHRPLALRYLDKSLTSRDPRNNDVLRTFSQGADNPR